MRQAGSSGLHLGTPLVRLQDPSETRAVIVTLAGATPVPEAAHLREDLRRAEIEPDGWVINRSLAATSTTDPLLRARAAAELEEMRAVAARHAGRVFVVPWSTDEPMGAGALRGPMLTPPLPRAPDEAPYPATP